MRIHRSFAAAGLITMLALGAASCGRSPADQAPLQPDAFKARREAMVSLVAGYSPRHRVDDPRVLEAMRKIPRHEFVPESVKAHAYDDTPLSIGEGQTISQPFIVGYMTQILELKASDRVLEVGTGSGYQAAVLAEIVKDVYTIEILESLARRAEAALKKSGYANVHVKTGDGYRGWPEAAPFDAIIVTCAPEHIPQPLVDQLKPGGRIVIPVGSEEEGPWSAQERVMVKKTGGKPRIEKRMDVRFVPMQGEARKVRR